MSTPYKLFLGYSDPFLELKVYTFFWVRMNSATKDTQHHHPHAVGGPVRQREYRLSRLETRRLLLSTASGTPEF